jgi:hypothetical protein
MPVFEGIRSEQIEQALEAIMKFFISDVDGWAFDAGSIDPEEFDDLMNRAEDLLYREGPTDHIDDVDDFGDWGKDSTDAEDLPEMS